MSFPKRAPNLRTITVQDAKFRWRFVQKEYNSTLSVYADATYSHPLIFTFPELQDSWWIIPGDKTKEVTTIGPKFVSEAIAWGLANGWEPTSHGSPMRAKYSNCEFKLMDGVRISPTIV